MAIIKAFKALRFTSKAGDIKELVCPPYDIISEEQRKAYLNVNPHNVIRLELPREGADVYKQAGETLNKWISEGILQKDSEDSIYIYEEQFIHEGKTYSFKGFICRVQLEEFSKGIVLPHEETLSKAKNDRFSLMSSTDCNFSQIYSLYSDDEGETSGLLERLSEREPDISFTDDDGVIQRFWIVSDTNAAAALAQQFEARKVYIADGHHRYETALNYRNHLRDTAGAPLGAESDYVMMMLVDMKNPGLVVFPTHRIVKNIGDFDGKALLSKCSEVFHVKQFASRGEVTAELRRLYDAMEKSLGYYDKLNGWQVLTLKDKSSLSKILKDKSPALASLDVTVLHSLILEAHLGINPQNMANQSNLIYTRSDEEAENAANMDADCCFLMNPTRVDEIAAVAAEGGKMPQKSTYFYPKLITGVVMNKF